VARQWHRAGPSCHYAAGQELQQSHAPGRSRR
jgi:hypothetical protein